MASQIVAFSLCFLLCLSNAHDKVLRRYPYAIGYDTVVRASGTYIECAQPYRKSYAELPRPLTSGSQVLGLRGTKAEGSSSKAENERSEVSRRRRMKSRPVVEASKILNMLSWIIVVGCSAALLAICGIRRSDRDRKTLTLTLTNSGVVVDEDSTIGSWEEC